MKVSKYARVNVSKEELIELYHVKELSIHDIAEKFSCSSTAISNKFKKFGIDRDHEREAKIISELISVAGKGRKFSEAHKQNIAKKLTGKKRPGIGGCPIGTIAWNKGLTKLNNPDKITNGLSKEAHWNWKGGTSSKNSLVRNSPEYKDWRSKVFKRDNWTCQKCSKRGGQRIEAHHVKKVSEFPDLIFEVENGLTLCVKCHKALHKEETSCLQIPHP